MSKRSRFQKKNRKKKQLKNPNIISPSSRTNLSLEQIKGLISEKKYSQVISFFEEESKRCNLTDEQLLQFAWAVYFEEGAEKALEILLQINQINAGALYLKGFCYLDIQKWEDAITTYEKLLDEADKPFVRELLCESLLKGRKIPDLFWLSSYEKSDEEKEKEKADNQVALARMKEILEAAITQDKCPAQCFLMLEDIWYYENNSQVSEDLKNIELLNKALSLWSENESIRMQLAKRLWILEKKEEALDILSWAFTAENPSGSILLQSINYLNWSENYDEALKYFEVAKEKNVFWGEAQNLYKAQWRCCVNSCGDK